MRSAARDWSGCAPPGAARVQPPRPPPGQPAVRRPDRSTAARSRWRRPPHRRWPETPGEDGQALRVAGRPYGHRADDVAGQNAGDRVTVGAVHVMATMLAVECPSHDRISG